MFVRVQKEDFSLKLVEERFSEYTKLQGAKIGAIVTFTGLVREFQHTSEDQEEVQALILEHYPGMTESVLEQIAQTAIKKWQLNDMLIIHRVGTLFPTDNIVLVAAASAHRQDAFDACQYAMDILKTSAPFWKKEQTNKGERWVDAKSSDYNAAGQWITQDLQEN
ncbi:MAG: molybdenum cofactor biosynthesis protein MoaE [Kangiellaceae bacterium]|nr:molybdenum cofactor biosynthesis protein MoaE [Kangiellaceae bacterium]